MRTIDITKVVEYREDNRLEAKRASNGLPSSLWETYSSFANTDGGAILLGVDEDKRGNLTVTGVNDADKLIKDFWNIINNRQKVSINILTEKDVTVENIDGKDVIIIHVPRAERSIRPVYIGTDPRKGTFRRNHEGDYHCSPYDMSAMFRDAYQITQDKKVLSDIALDAICLDTVHSYRNRFNVVHPRHAWQEDEDFVFLRKIGAVAFDKENQLHPTAAGLLMFGYEYEITREYNQYFLDYREVKDIRLRWVDRIVSNSGEWSGNLFDFYFLIVNKLTVDLPRPFKLDGITRIDETPVAEAIREALLNTLVNADYYGPRGLVIIKSLEGYKFANPGCLRISQKEALSGGISDPRNSTIFSMFSLVDLGERAGTGIPSIYYAWENAFDLKPTLIDMHNPDRTEMFVPKMRDGFVSENHIKKPLVAVNEVSPSVKDDSPSVKNDSPSVKDNSSSVKDDSSSVKSKNVAAKEDSPSVNRITKKDRKEQILEVCSSEKSFTPLEISKYMKASPITIREYLRELVKEGKLGFTGTFRNRSYHIINKD